MLALFKRERRKKELKMRIDNKKALTLIALTLLITSLLLVNMNGPTSAQSSGDIVYLDGPPLEPIHMNSNKTLTPVHMHYKYGELPVTPPYETAWHQLYPDFCENWTLTSWENVGEPFPEGLSPNDQIDMINEDTQKKRWYHVDRMTWTMRLYNDTQGDPIWVEYKGPYEPIYDPTWTLWHQVAPPQDYSNHYQIVNWADNQNGFIDVCDHVELDGFPGIWWHVEDYATDIILREKLVDPICTWWHAIYPEEEYCKWYHVTEPWENMTSPYFSPGDQINMTEKESGNWAMYFVDRITVTLNVSYEWDKSRWMKIELKSDFEEIYTVFKSPWDTRWHEVYPDYCNIYNLTWWDLYSDDNCNGVLDVCDFIWLVNATGQEPETRWHIDDMTYDLILNRKIADPTCTTWHELDPDFCEIAHEYHITGWEDNTDELLSPCDNVTMELDPPSGLEDKYHVESMTLTLNLTVIDPMGGPVSQGQRIFIELLDVPYEYMYWPKIEPEYQYDWEIVCPGWLPGVFWIENWDDNCNGVLSHCDNITLVDPTGLPFVCHVDEVAVDMVVEKVAEPVHDVAVTEVFSLYDQVYQGEIDPISVTVTNNGDFQETVTVYAFYQPGTQAAPPQTIFNMNPGDVQTLTFNWNTAGVPPGPYTVSANATIAHDDYPGNNTATGNTELVLAFHWKKSYSDYAPSGMPDFDQNQFGATWCAPTAVANSLWWMDSRYNASKPLSDLLTNYTTGVWANDWDHDPQNVQHFVPHLAYLMDTNGMRTSPPGPGHIGTNVIDMEAGITHYLSWAGNGTINPQGDVNGDGIVDQTDYNLVVAANNTTPLLAGWNMAADIWPVTTGWPNRIPADNVINQNDINLVTANLGKNGSFYEHTVAKPDFFFIEEEVERCQDVVLCLGFWMYLGGDPNDPSSWYRDELDHCVTVAGVNSSNMLIAICDPDKDAFENQQIPNGRIPVPHLHVPPGNNTTHNNASLVSQDIYQVIWDPCPGGNWSILGYPGWDGWHVQIEYAVITSPLEAPDVGVTDVVPCMDYCPCPISEAYPAWSVNVTVTVENFGTTSATFTVSAYANDSLIGTQPVNNLPAGQNTTLTFNWDLSSSSVPSNYTLKANVTLIGDTNPGNDEHINGQVKVKVFGDVDGNNLVNPTDVNTYMAFAYGSSFGQPNYNCQCDFNADSYVNPTDINTYLAFWYGYPW